MTRALQRYALLQALHAIDGLSSTPPIRSLSDSVMTNHLMKRNPNYSVRTYPSGALNSPISVASWHWSINSLHVNPTPKTGVNAGSGNTALPHRRFSMTMPCCAHSLMLIYISLTAKMRSSSSLHVAAINHLVNTRPV